MPEIEKLSAPSTYQGEPFETRLRLVKERYLTLLEIINFGIAQQALLAGDVLLPKIYKDLSETKNKQLLSKIFSTEKSKNQYIARNYVTYFLHKRLGELHSFPLVEYATAMDLKSIEYFRKILKLYEWGGKGTLVKFEISSDMVFMEVMGKRILLPSVEEFKTGTFVLNQGLTVLLNLRDWVLSEMAELHSSDSGNIALKIMTFRKMEQKTRLRKIERKTKKN